MTKQKSTFTVECADIQKLKQTISSSERRIKAIDKAIGELFEANISGKITDERFVKMTANYEKEQKELIEQVAESNKKLQAAEQNKVDIYFTAVGLFSIPTGKELQAMMEEIRQNPKQLNASA